MTLLSSRIYPKGVSEAAGVLHKSGCSAQALSLWPLSHLSLWPLSHLSLFFITVPWLSGFEAFPEPPPPWSFLPMGIGGQHRGCLGLMPFSFGEAFLGDALSWRRPFLATPYPGDAFSCLLYTSDAADE